MKSRASFNNRTNTPANIPELGIVVRSQSVSGSLMGGGYFSVILCLTPNTPCQNTSISTSMCKCIPTTRAQTGINFEGSKPPYPQLLSAERSSLPFVISLVRPSVIVSAAGARFFLPNGPGLHVTSIMRPPSPPKTKPWLNTPALVHRHHRQEVRLFVVGDTFEASLPLSRQVKKYRQFHNSPHTICRMYLTYTLAP